MMEAAPPESRPTSAEERLAALRLLRSRRVGPATFFRLLGEHGTAAAALLALPEVARAAGMVGYAPCPEGVALAEMKAARAAGARLLAWGAAEYPAALADLADAPPLLWAIGDPALLARPTVAIVGARNASSLGIRMARKLASGLSEAGFAIVSGLARGIDTAAHEAALGGGTIAVMAGGIDVVYPPENAGLAAAIAERGLRLSEQPMGVEPQARHFPRRNRLVSGLGRAVVVVEAAAKSGSLITARTALDQGREVLAVPGHPLDARAGGCNLLIRDGATLVRSVEDVIEALAPLATSARTQRAGTRDVHPARRQVAPGDPPRPALPETTTLQSAILSRLGPSPVAEDQLVRDIALPVQTVAPEILTLELEGRILRQAGGLLSLPS